MELSKEQRKHLVKQSVAALFCGEGRLAAKGFSAAASGVWEGHERNRFRDRPSKPLSSVDQDMDYGTREKMASEARALTQTFGLFKRIMRQYSAYTVGSCLMKWNTGDPAIDRIYRKYWREWMPMSDANGVHHFQKQTRIAVCSAIRDGRAIGQKIKDFEFGQVRLIESDRVNSTGSAVNCDEEKYDTQGNLIYKVIGGIKVNAQGRRVSARVWERNKFGGYKNPKEVPWSEIFYAFDTDRVDDTCGLTAFHTALNPARDYKETKEAEILSAKRISKWALLIKTAFGGASVAGGVDLFADPSGSSAAQAATGVTPRIDVQQVNTATDAFLSNGDDVSAIESNRPSAGWQWLMVDTVREIAAGLDLPFGVVWNMSGLGGPAARFEINQAARTFGTFTADVLEPKWLIPIAGWKIAEGIENGSIPFHPNWGNFKPQRPAFITIDLGRDSKAGIEENKACLLTATSWFEEIGQDFEEETETLFQEERFRMDMAEKYKVPIGNVRLLTPNGNPATPENEPAKESQKEEQTA